MKTILLKLSGTLLAENNKDLIVSVAQQIKALHPEYCFSIVIGGGNILRGAKSTHIKRTTADNMGMLATLINGLMLHDIFSANNINTCLMSAIHAPDIVKTITQHSIDKALEKNQCIIFAGGTGNPYFSTDTNAVIRALQINATQVWKATNVDGIYTADPAKDKTSTLVKKISHEQVLGQKLEILDATAIILAQQHKLPVRVFNMFAPEALIHAAKDLNFGSTIK
ncbi:MAG: UMP kinase [bacterium]